MKFTKYCPQTSTGLWSGITDKPKYTEEEIKKDLLFLIKHDDRNLLYALLQLFLGYTFSSKFMNDIFELTPEYIIHKLEVEYITKVLINKIDTTQTGIINCITYVKNGLVKYHDGLEKTLEYKTNEVNNAN